MDETTPHHPGTGEPDPDQGPLRGPMHKVAEVVREATNRFSAPGQEPSSTPQATRSDGDDEAPEPDQDASTDRAVGTTPTPVVAPAPVASPRPAPEPDRQDGQDHRPQVQDRLAPTVSAPTSPAPADGHLQSGETTAPVEQEPLADQIHQAVPQNDDSDRPAVAARRYQPAQDTEVRRSEVHDQLAPTLASSTSPAPADGHLQSGETTAPVEQEPLADQIHQVAQAGTTRDEDEPADDADHPTPSRTPGTGAPLTPSQRRSGGWINVPDAAEPDGTTRRPVPHSVETLGAVGEGAHWNPHSVLGAHVGEDGVTVRTLRPFAESVSLVTGNREEPRYTPMEHEAHGIWTAVIDGDQIPDYRISVRYEGGRDTLVDDPYRFLPTLGETDLHLINEGRHENLWHVLGSRVQRYPGGPMGEVEGVSFAVWAPNARAVRLASDDNHWDGRATQLRSLGSSGVWEIFVPGMRAGQRYKYQILGQDGGWREKADPMAQHTEVPPATASVVFESSYQWHDDAWLQARGSRPAVSSPMSTYEVHLGSWRKDLDYREMAAELVDYVTAAGFTHVEFMPLAEHPFGGSWGYQVTGYYAPTSRFGSPDDLRYLVDQLHQAGIGVIMDWVPAHFPKDAFALARFDGGPLYEHPDPRRGDHPDWGTFVFDFGRPEVRNFLVANALYWCEEFHLDGLRVDAVASMLYLDYSRQDGQWAPNQYGGREHLEAIQLLQEFNATLYRRVPGVVTLAEESTAWPGVTKPTEVGGLGFGFKWNMGWMHDSLNYVAEDPIHRQYHHGQMTFSMVYAFSENYVLPISHDEVVHGKGSLLTKMPGDRWQQLANLRAYLAFMWAHPGKKLLFMGQEFGQEAEWNEARGLDWWLLDQPLHAGALAMVSDLNRIYRAEPALFELDHDPSGFEWIDGNDAQRNLFSFVRRDTAGREVVVVVNFAGQPYEDFRLALPRAGQWHEILNTDDVRYGGSGVVNPGPVVTQDVPWTDRDQSAQLRIPPLGATFLTQRPR